MPRFIKWNSLNLTKCLVDGSIFQRIRRSSDRIKQRLINFNLRMQNDYFY